MSMRSMLAASCISAGLLVLPLGASYAASASPKAPPAATQPAPATPEATPAEEATPADQGAPPAADQDEPTASQGAPIDEQAANAPAPAIEPAAMEALSKMSAYLRTLQAFEVRADTVREEVDDHDQKLQFLGTTTYKARKNPEGLAVDVAEDRRVRHFVYDGKSASMLAPRMGVYTTISAPPTIRETLDLLATKYNIVFPLEDLFLWGTDADRRADIKKAYVVGYARMAGKDADQFAFHQDDVDWQIWIARGNAPLPLRVVITGTADPKLPQTEASLAWTTAPKFAADTFAFKPPSGARQISIATASP